MHALSFPLQTLLLSLLCFLRHALLPSFVDDIFLFRQLSLAPHLPPLFPLYRHRGTSSRIARASFSRSFRSNSTLQSSFCDALIITGHSSKLSSTLLSLTNYHPHSNISLSLSLSLRRSHPHSPLSSSQHHLKLAATVVIRESDSIDLSPSLSLSHLHSVSCYITFIFICVCACVYLFVNGFEYETLTQYICFFFFFKNLVWPFFVVFNGLNGDYSRR